MTRLRAWIRQGWHLGDNDVWASEFSQCASKLLLRVRMDAATDWRSVCAFPEMTNFEHATKIPLMIGCPGGKCVGRTSALVESIDIMPTLLQEAGITAPACPPTHAGSRATTFCVEGRSLSPLLREPTTPTVLAGYGAAYSQFPRPEHPRTIDLSCRDDPKTQKGCASGPCLDGCPNKMGKSVQCPSLW
jgi:hypothetical protein